MVASKVHFTSNASEMEEFVTSSHVISALGGEDPWSYKYVESSIGENKLMEDTATRDKLLTERSSIVKNYETATLSWINNKPGDDLAAIKSQRNNIAKQLREDYWRLDPYIRARSYYDRTGMIQTGGAIHFYPQTAPPVQQAPAATSGQQPIENNTHNVETSAADID